VDSECLWLFFGQGNLTPNAPFNFVADRGGTIPTEFDRDGLPEVALAHARGIQVLFNQSAAPDSDVEGWSDGFACAPLDGSAYAIPREVMGLRFGADTMTLARESAAPGGGRGTVHPTLRIGRVPRELRTLRAALMTGAATSTLADPLVLGSGGFFSLVPGHGARGAGNYGISTGGAVLTNAACL
jgi:hypothetical protein